MYSRLAKYGVPLLALATAAWAQSQPPSPLASAPSPDSFRRQVEADWLAQEELRTQSAQTVTVTPEEDAFGAVDGVKNGEWGFHTGGGESQWWQVDLGAVVAAAQVVVYNRCTGGADRAARLQVRLSADAASWETVYTHGGTVFLGFTDGQPLRVSLGDRPARFVRIELPGNSFLHLDEVEVYGPADPTRNLALRQPATQCSASQWSVAHLRVATPVVLDGPKRAREVAAQGRALARDLQREGVDTTGPAAELATVVAQLESPATGERGRDLYLRARWAYRRLLLASPLLAFDDLLFAKRVPGTFSHMSDENYGWWSRPGGGLCILRGFRTEAPRVEVLLESPSGQPGNVHRPDLAFDGRRLLFAWCRYYPGLAANPDKLNKANVPEDAFYHVYEMNTDGTGLRQLTHGRYDDFDPHYLPGGRIAFLSTRRGQAVQCTAQTGAATLATPDLPDSYVRCGGGPERPVAVYTLHTMAADGADLVPISPFEMFEWTPSVSHDGSILYARWDYIDRNNMPYMSLWAVNPDGSSPRLVYGNFTTNPHCIFEPRAIPGSRKLVFTASAHHAHIMGSLVLLDPAVANEQDRPIRRLTPEVSFPETEGWPRTYFLNPWPLSERLHLVAWSNQRALASGGVNPANASGLYLFDAATGALELLHRDPAISSMFPTPLAPRPTPPVLAGPARRDTPPEGRFLVADVYRGLGNTRRGEVKAIRIVGVPAKTHPTMNQPNLGVTADDPGKFVLGTVPVAADGSAFFRAPAGVIVFFQALDERGVAIQTMRSATHVQPGQTQGCIGCHEPRYQAAPRAPLMAAAQEPARITLGPDGSWPFRFDRLIQPVLDRHCVRCHAPGSARPEAAAKLDLTPARAWSSLVAAGQPSLREQVRAGYARGQSVVGDGIAARSYVLAKITDPKRHPNLDLDRDTWERLVVWMDAYAQIRGAFSDEQEQDLLRLRDRSADLLAAYPAASLAAAPREPPPPAAGLTP